MIEVDISNPLTGGFSQSSLLARRDRIGAGTERLCGISVARFMAATDGRPPAPR
jgi:hypothetical protein